MGGQYSTIKLETNDIIDIISKSVINTSNNCSSSIIQKQSIDLKKTGDVEISGIDFNQSSTLNITCLQDLKKDIDTSTIVAQDIISQIDSKISGQNIGLQVSNSEEIKNIAVKLATELNYTSIANCIVDVAQLQEIKVEEGKNIKITNNSFEQTIEMLKNCIQRDETTIKNITELQQTIETFAKSSTEGALNTTTIIFIVIGLFFILLIILVIKKMITGTGGNSSNGNSVTGNSGSGSGSGVIGTGNSITSGNYKIQSIS